MKKTVRDIDVAGKRVLVRVDFNVPFTGDGSIADDSRIRAAVPTIDYLREQKARVILCSHLGRPDGKVVESMRMAPVAARLSEILATKVATATDCIGDEASSAAEAIGPGQVLLLENLRFHPEEEKNDPEFARKLASLADVYVNDAFGTAHRAHASTAGVTAYLPAVAGFLMEKELNELGRLLADPARPFGVILGGAKISSKLAVLNNLLPLTDRLFLGGGIASTFLKAQGLEVGDSLVEDDLIETARNILRDGEAKGVKIYLPIDVVLGDRFATDAAVRTVPSNEIPAGWRIMDMGPETIASFGEGLAECGTIFWNGTPGVAEFPAFAKGSLALAELLAKVPGTVVVGGGDTAVVVEDAGLRDKYSHVSTGGGASLEFLEGRVLPGVAALDDA